MRQWQFLAKINTENRDNEYDCMTHDNGGFADEENKGEHNDVDNSIKSWDVK